MNEPNPRNVESGRARVVIAEWDYSEEYPSLIDERILQREVIYETGLILRDVEWKHCSYKIRKPFLNSFEEGPQVLQGLGDKDAGLLSILVTRA